MAMRETVRSLKAYFIVSALLSALANLRVLIAGGGVGVVSGLLGLAFAAAFLYVGFRLRHLLQTTPRQVTTLLMAAAGFMVLIFLMDILVGAGAGSWPMVAVGLLLTWYLFVNVRRLAAEGQPSGALTGSSGSDVHGA